MARKSEPSNFAVELGDGSSLSRRRAELLPDGAYLFADGLQVAGVLAPTVITCTAWLFEFYDLHSGELSFISGEQQLRPQTKRFGVLYPPFSISQPCFSNVKGQLVGVAATDPLPKEFTDAPAMLDMAQAEPPAGLSDVVALLQAGQNRLSVAMNPRPSLLSLKAKRLIDENYLAYPAIARIAARLGVTHEHLSRQFKRDFTMTPSAYFRQLRVADAPLKLARGEEIINVSHDVGYNDLSRFYKQFRKTTKTSPGVCQSKMRPSPR